MGVSCLSRCRGFIPGPLCKRHGPIGPYGPMGSHAAHGGHGALNPEPLLIFYFWEFFRAPFGENTFSKNAPNQNGSFVLYFACNIQMVHPLYNPFYKWCLQVAKMEHTLHNKKKALKGSCTK